jgi:hypothetical protein
MGRGTCALCVAFGILAYLASDVAAGDWKDAARKAKLTSAEIERLARDKMLVTGRQYRQVFTPYVEPQMPIFVTSDATLYVYHVLLEESVFRLELANAEKLPMLLELLWKNLSEPVQLVGGQAGVADAARRRAQIVVGTALGLLRTQRTPSDPKTEELIRAEVGRVEKAAGVHTPGWLDETDREYAIDYSRYKPRGFYVQVDTLARYFRAVSWLQSIPFRVNRDDELLAILMLGDSMSPDRLPNRSKRRQFEAYFECFREFVGDRDDWDLAMAAAAAEKHRADIRAGEVTGVRRWLNEKAKQTTLAAINDLVSRGLIPLSFRFLSAHRTPDSVLFHRTTNGLQDATKVPRNFPTGLEICVVLGSDYAPKSLPDLQKDRLLAILKESTSLFSGGSLYCDEMQCLSTLFAPPPPVAPAFMKTDAWQTKSCTTALAGWAQLRHTWVLQGKHSNYYLSDEDESPVGFVEPNPAFFSRMKTMAKRVAGLLSRAGACNDPKTLEVAQLQKLLRFLKANATSGKGLDMSAHVDEWLALSELWSTPYLYKESSPEEAKVLYSKAIAKVQEAIADIQKGRRDSGSASQNSIEAMWQWFGMMSETLEALAMKELAAPPFNHATFTKEDREFLVAYGHTVARLTFHFGQLAEFPRDDAPRIADVFFNPNVGKYLEVGIGRPRALYVLYSTTKGEVLSRGVVLPYYELLSPNRLDDAKWKEKLDSRDRPAPPSWSNVPMGDGRTIASGRVSEGSKTDKER